MFWEFILAIFFVYYLFKQDTVKHIKKWKKLLDFSKTIPGPSGLDLLKNTHKDRVIPWFKELRANCGPVFKIWMGTDMYVFLTEPDDVKDMLSNNFLLHRTRIYDNMRPWLGNGLLTSEGNEWRSRRKALTPAFHFNILGGFRDSMNICSDILMKKLDLVADGREFDIYPYYNLFSLDVICETAMGVNKNAQEESDAEYVQAIKTVCKVLTNRAFSIWKRIPRLFALSKGATDMKNALKIIHDDTMNVIKQRRKVLEQQLEEGEQLVVGNEAVGKRRLAFLDMILMAQREGADLTDENIREEVDTFMFAGHDTVSTTFGFCTYLLSTHPEVQERILAEALSLPDGHDSNTQYLDAVIKESLRLYPSVPFFSRKLQEDVEIGSRTIPAGTSLSIVPFLLHMDPVHNPDPQKFDPERFIDNPGRHPFAQVSFSAGARNCIGQKFAMLELRSTLSKLIQTFKILPVAGYTPQLTLELTLKSNNGIRVRLQKRN